MFNKDDLVLYRTEGIYKVADVCVPDISDAPDRLYYVMESLNTDTTTYTPVDAKVSIRKIVTKQDAMNALAALPSREAVDLSSKSHKHLKDYYVSAIQNQEFENLLLIYKSIMHKKAVVEKDNKKLCQTDVSYLRKITKLLAEEISVALNMKAEAAAVCLEQALTGGLN